MHPIPNGYTDVRACFDDVFDPDISMVAVGQVCGVLNEVQSASQVVQGLLGSLQDVFADLARRFPTSFDTKKAE